MKDSERFRPTASGARSAAAVVPAQACSELLLTPREPALEHDESADGAKDRMQGADDGIHALSRALDSFGADAPLLCVRAHVARVRACAFVCRARVRCRIRFNPSGAAGDRDSRRAPEAGARSSRRLYVLVYSGRPSRRLGRASALRRTSSAH